jgi:mannose-1-phosphate guanylyltransferase / mannose-6-phosphate isomerase
MKIVILAGGGGTRLWPLSKESFPKQFLTFDKKGSLLQKTFKRFEKFHEVSDIVVVTGANYKKLVERQLESKRYHLLIEPSSQNTAPAIVLAVKYLEKKCHLTEDEKILVLPSDHFLEPAEEFLKALKLLSSKKSDQLLTFGVLPSRAETGYGYIELGDKKGDLFKVKRFIEKPDLKRAKLFLKGKHHLWNLGIFLFSLKTFWKELKRHAPSIYHLASQGYEKLFASFASLPKISIDYALMEKSKNLAVYPFTLNWSDIGSWDSLFEIFPKDAQGNVKQGNIISLETKNSLIMGKRRLIATIGLEDLLIIDTKEALLIAKRGKSQKVKELARVYKLFGDS